MAARRRGRNGASYLQQVHLRDVKGREFLEKLVRLEFEPYEIVTFFESLTMIQMAFGCMATLYRPDWSIALATVGLFGAMNRRFEAIKLYMALAAASVLVDVVWLCIYGHQLHLAKQEMWSKERVGLNFGVGMTTVGLMLRIFAGVVSYKVFTVMPPSPQEERPVRRQRDLNDNASDAGSVASRAASQRRMPGAGYDQMRSAPEARRAPSSIAPSDGGTARGVSPAPGRSLSPTPSYSKFAGGRPASGNFPATKYANAPFGARPQSENLSSLMGRNGPRG